VDLLRSLRNAPPAEKPEMVTLATTDPANLYGSVLRWPSQDDLSGEDAPRMLTRSSGTSVVLRNGELVAYLRRSQPNLQVFLPAEEPDRSATARDLSTFLATLAQQEMDRREDHRGGMLIAAINGQPAAQHYMASFLQDAGFHVAPMGLNYRRMASSLLPAAVDGEDSSVSKLQ
jgi:ATP-dependent Lhr-like helicase